MTHAGPGRIAVLLAAAALALTPARASDSGNGGDTSATDKHREALWIFEYENDLFGGEDRYYTSGIRMSRIDPGANAPGWLRDIAGLFPVFRDARALPYGFSIGQNIYSPADIENPVPVPEDRPYAGWLHLDFVTGVPRNDGAHRFLFSLGITGPASLAQESQEVIHDLVGAPQPVGWDQQIETEPTIQIAYDRIYRSSRLKLSESSAMDASLYGGVQLGNAYTNVNAGTFIRVGKNLPMDYGPPRITPATSGSGYFEPTPGTGWYFYAGVEGRRVFRDMFIEGNTFGGVNGPEALDYVGEAFAGWVFARGPIRLSYTQVWRNREFRGQPSGQDYGSFSVSFWW